MEIISTIFLYAVLFIAVYVQVFLLVTYFDTRNSLPNRTGDITLSQYPTVTVLVPCWNEEETICGTVDSILSLRYPKDKLQIIMIDDGSTDATLERMHTYRDNPMVRIIHQENGGKHTALNNALQHVDTEFVATLDADSFVSPYALQRVIDTFLHDDETDAVVSSIVIHQPKTLVQYAQKAEYEMSVYVKNMLAHINGLHVTPGPFSVFRRRVFDMVGGYKKAHNTEDCEFALRMHSHGLRVGYCTDSYVYTVGPSSIKALFKQRVRWTYGFIRNMIDYRSMIGRPRYMGLGLFTLPTAILSFITVIVTLGFILYHITSGVIPLVGRLNATGFDMSTMVPNWFDISITATMVVMVTLYVFVGAAIVMGRKMSRQRIMSIKDVVLFIALAATVAPVFIAKSVVDTIRSKQSTWK